jgi:tetratricopeptide (TPR) repeat protein
MRRVLGKDHPWTLGAMGNLGDLYTSLGRYDEGHVLLVEAVEGVRRALPEVHVIAGNTIRKHGRSLTALGRYAESEAVLLEAHEILTAAVGSGHPQTQKAIRNLAELYEAWDKPDKAVEWRGKLPPEGKGE